MGMRLLHLFSFGSSRTGLLGDENCVRVGFWAELRPEPAPFAQSFAQMTVPSDATLYDISHPATSLPSHGTMQKGSKQCRLKKDGPGWYWPSPAAWALRPAVRQLVSRPSLVQQQGPLAPRCSKVTWSQAQPSGPQPMSSIARNTRAAAKGRATPHTTHTPTFANCAAAWTTGRGVFCVQTNEPKESRCLTRS